MNRPGFIHRQRDVFVRDARRQNRLLAAGWTVHRFTSADLLGRPDEVIAGSAGHWPAVTALLSPAHVGGG